MALNRQDAKVSQDAKRKRREPPEYVDAWARRVIGAAIEVHRGLGPGYLEIVYEEALTDEFELQAIPFERQRAFRVAYKGQEVGEGKVDFLVAECLPVEIKAVDHLAAVHEAQTIGYLKALGLPLALLINFKVAVLREGIKRVVLS